MLPNGRRSGSARVLPFCLGQQSVSIAAANRSARAVARRVIILIEAFSKAQPITKGDGIVPGDVHHRMIFVVRSPSRVLPRILRGRSLESLCHTVPTSATSSSFRFGDVICLLHKLSELTDGDFIDSDRECQRESDAVLRLVVKVCNVNLWPQLLNLLPLIGRGPHQKLPRWDQRQLHADGILDHDFGPEMVSPLLLGGWACFDVKRGYQGCR